VDYVALLSKAKVISNCLTAAWLWITPYAKVSGMFATGHGITSLKEPTIH
jgi:hypothetical protein